MTSRQIIEDRLTRLIEDLFSPMELHDWLRWSRASEVVLEPLLPDAERAHKHSRAYGEVQSSALGSPVRRVF